MRLIVIGNSTRAQIVLNSQYVSGYHAELIQLDNGDMFIVDKNSTNGTFVNGQKIEPEKEVSITRGTNITFADVPLDWNRVPELVVDSNAKALIGIGTHVRNKIRLSGNRVSRFHATIKQTRDGKWYICDHSTNGTTVNGSRISKDQWVLLKRGDTIKCAGYEVENPVPSSGAGKVIGITAAVLAGIAAIVAIVIGLGRFSKSDAKLYDTYKSAVAFIKVGYHYHLSCPTMEQLEPAKWRQLEAFLGDTDFTISYDSQGVSYPVPFNNYNKAVQDKPQPITASATGFFISKDGHMATNLHVAKPWLYGADKYNVDVMQLLIKNLLNRAGPGYAEYQNDLKVEGVMDFIKVIPNAYYNIEKNAIPAVEYTSSSSEDIDISIIKLQYEESLPGGCTYVDLNKIAEVKNGVHIFTLGYPMGEYLQEENEKIEAASSGGDVLKVEKDSFIHNATTTGGASGSPIFDEYGALVGIHHAYHAQESEYRCAIKASYIKRLLEQEANKQI